MLAEIEDEDEEEDYYYDMHPTKEDLMSESIPHLTLIRYLLDVLEQLFLTPGWLAAGNLKIYQTPDKKEYPLAPDVAFLGGVALSKKERGRRCKPFLRSCGNTILILTSYRAI